MIYDRVAHATKKMLLDLRIKVDVHAWDIDHRVRKWQAHLEVTGRSD